MRVQVRISLLAALAGAIVAVAAPAAQAAVGIERFVAVNCQEGFKECGEEAGPETVFGKTKVPKENFSQAEAEKEGYTQAGGRVPYGITDFKLSTVTTKEPLPTTEAPTGIVNHIRTDVAPGLATSPAAVAQCSGAEFGEKEEIPGTGFYSAPKCATSGEKDTVIGENEVTVYAGKEAGDVPLSGSAYNLVPPEGLASEFGVALELPMGLTKGALEKAFAEKGHPLGEPTEKILEEKQYFAHTLIEGNVEWGKEENGTNQGDYHDYFEVKVSTALPLIRSRLTFEGRRGDGAFITNATSCPGHNTTRLAVTGTEESTVARSFTAPIGLSGCNLVPFEPTLSLTPATTGHDEPDGFTAEVGVPQHPNELESSQVKTAVITLPEGMTLNPSAAAGLTACTPAQARINSSVPGTACPASSQIGTVSIEVPTLPAGSLKGSIYLGGPETGPITGPPYIVYLDAESARYGVSVRIKGQAMPNAATGQVVTTFSENPEQPFTTAILHFKEGALAPIANPLVCGTATTEATLTPFTETAAKSPTSAFTVDSNGKGGSCPSPLSFAPTQSTQDEPASAGVHPSFTFNLERPEGQQYLGKVSTVLPAGLVGQIPAVGQCTEAQALAAQCPESSLLGSVSALSGSGPTPYLTPGKVYFMGPTKGAPYGMAFIVPAVAGPFNLGNVVTLATINVDPSTARVIVSSEMPTIVKGVPIRLRKLSVSVTRSGFLLNPTNCGVLATESAVTGITGPSAPLAGGTTISLSSPFQIGNCGALAFKPKFGSASSARTSKANGASLETTLKFSGLNSNVKSVLVQLPKQLPSRLTTLQKACPEATFAANPFSCPSGSFVGGARANTPVLPSKMTGPAILVSHAAAAFPDLDLVLQADGIRVILVGNTDIKKGITTTNFANTPDVPVSAITVNLPLGAHSALAANGNICLSSLLMPTTVTAQNGSTFKQNTKIKINGCGVKIVGHKVIGNTAYLTIQTFAAGRISGSGSNLATVYRHLGSAVGRATLKVPLSSSGRREHRPFRTRLRVGFLPKKPGAHSTAYVTVTFG